MTNGVPDNLPDGLDRTDSATANGTITATDADGDPLIMTLGTPSELLTSGGVTITWTLYETSHTLVGKAGATTIITATITDAGAYTVTLNGPIDHPAPNPEAPLAEQENDKTFDVPVFVSDNHTSTATTLPVTVEDDSPKAAPVDVSISSTGSMTNVMLILDLSGSMNNSSGLPGLTTRFAVAKAAVTELLEQYDDRGNVMVRIVWFSSAGHEVGESLDQCPSAKAAILNLPRAQRRHYYEAALSTAIRHLRPRQIDGLRNAERVVFSHRWRSDD